MYRYRYIPSPATGVYIFLAVVATIEEDYARAALYAALALRSLAGKRGRRRSNKRSAKK